jgi:hypothetical protein
MLRICGVLDVEGRELVARVEQPRRMNEYVYTPLYDTEGIISTCSVQNCPVDSKRGIGPITLEFKRLRKSGRLGVSNQTIIRGYTGGT